ncbi:YbaB/EbfC family nucleoid-associated protein [Patescibacteria group bacterium]
MFDKLKQLKELRDQAKDLKSKLAEITVSAQAEDDKITVVMNGNQEIVSVDIDASLLIPDQKEKVQKGLIEAINQASKKAKSEMAKQFQQGNFQMPNFGS